MHPNHLWKIALDALYLFLPTLPNHTTPKPPHVVYTTMRPLNTQLLEQNTGLRFLEELINSENCLPFSIVGRDFV